MIQYTGAMTDGGAELRRRERTMDPVAALSIVAETKSAARRLFLGLSDEEVDTLALRSLYGSITPGKA